MNTGTPRSGDSADAAAFAARVAECRARIEGVLERALALPDPGTARLREAMRYSVLGAGKRLRPTLVYLTGEALGAPLEQLDSAAAAVELIHVNSVAQRLEMIRVLARATGTSGMAGGQAVDLAAVGQTLSVAAIEDMHRRKTGALIQASVLLGALAAGVSDGPGMAALERFGAHVGLAFQIQDDILDVEGDPRVLGKSTGADAAHAKPTYPSTVGLESARVRARELRDDAIAALAPLGGRAAALTQLANFVVARVS